MTNGGFGQWTSSQPSTANVVNSHGLTFTIVPYAELPPPEPVVYSSRDHGRPGVGFPSCSREIALIPRNLNDANHFYFLIGLWPWATMAEIKRRCRKLLATYHPDGISPRPRMFERIEEIYRILTDPKERAVYDSVPPGYSYIDRFLKKKLFDQAAEQGRTHQDLVDDGDVTAREPEQDEPEPKRNEKGEPVNEDGDVITVNTPHWDYFAEVPIEDEGLDLELAQTWYALLRDAAFEIDYRGPLKILLTTTKSGFVKRAHMVRVPRYFDPTPEEAKKLLGQRALITRM